MAAAENPLPKVLPQTHGQDSRGLVLQHAANELIFGVVGHVGSGTSEIAEALRDILSDATLVGGAFQVQILKARDVIRDWAKQNGETLPDETARRLGGTITFQNLGDKMRAQLTSSGEADYPAVARGLILRVRESRATGLGQAVNGTDPVMPDGTRRAYVLDSLRHPAEIHLLRHVYQEAFVLIGVVCEEKQRLTRLTKKYRDAGEEDARAFMKRDAEAAEKHGQHVADTFHLSDFFVDNTTDRLLENKAPNPHWDTNEKLARMVKILAHSEIVRPAMAEVAMHHAYGAMMQSACLSRQVGAALVDANGNVVATGTNEVPKAGDGVYGESFVAGESDDRCGFVRAPERCSFPPIVNKARNTIACADWSSQSMQTTAMRDLNTF